MAEPELSGDQIDAEATKHLLWLQKIKESKIPDICLSLMHYRLHSKTEFSQAVTTIFRQFYDTFSIQQHYTINLRPIFLGDFEIQLEQTVFHTLLSECQRAIFEVTIDSGHLIEVLGYIRKKDVRILLGGQRLRSLIFYSKQGMIKPCLLVYCAYSCFCILYKPCSIFVLTAPMHIAIGYAAFIFGVQRLVTKRVNESVSSRISLDIVTLDLISIVLYFQPSEPHQELFQR